MKALRASRVFDGRTLHGPCVVLFEGETVIGLTDTAPDDAACIDLPPTALLAPGYVDLQVNGGGGVMFNDSPDLPTLARIAGAHRGLGTTAILPTLISSDAATRSRAIAAVADATTARMPGIAGLHLEGPFLAPPRRGIHPARAIAQPGEADIAALCAPFPAPLLITLAPEIAGPAMIQRLCAAGRIVFGGHSEAQFAQAQAAYDAGMSGVTHLFNAMSQLTGRAPGLVGAALLRGFGGIIADLHHVAAASVRIAYQAMGAERLFFVSDAMATLGSTAQGFEIDGNRITLHGGRLTDAHGTLAGAHVSMAESVRNAVGVLGVPLEDALRMATLTPSEAGGLERHGRIAPGARADFVALDAELAVQGVWVGGESAP